jgi:hypothetical protein
MRHITAVRTKVFFSIDYLRNGRIAYDCSRGSWKLLARETIGNLKTPLVVEWKKENLGAVLDEIRGHFSELNFYFY